MSARFVDPATWPMWPFGSRVVIRPAGGPELIGTIAAVGNECKLIMTGHADRRVYYRLSPLVAVAEITIDAIRYVIVDECDVLAILPDPVAK